MPPGRYLPTYRQDEVNQIAQAARQGQSLAFVGIAGIGKSNLIQYVCASRNLLPYIGNDASKIRFAQVDINTWEKTPTSLWQIMLQSLLEVTQEIPIKANSSKVIPMAEASERAFLRLKGRLQEVCTDADRTIIFILDDCDSLLRDGATAMIEQLNSLRNEGFRDKLAFLLFTKKLPHVLLRHNDSIHRFKFLDLFRDHVYSLGPYQETDALQMLEHLNNRASRPLRRADYGPILALAGGHARLIYTLYTLWLKIPAPTNNPVPTLANEQTIQDECHRIMQGLHLQEQEAVIAASKELLPSNYAKTFEHLITRGILQGTSPISWFTPLFPATLDLYEPKGDL